MGRRINISDQSKRRLVLALAFPLLSTLAICSPNSFFVNFKLMGINELFLSPALFLIVNAVVCYVTGIGIFCVRSSDPAEEYNGRVLLLSSFFLLNIWILLFVCAFSFAVSLVCGGMALFFSLWSISLLSRKGRVAFFSSILLSVWMLSLLFLNVRVLFS